SSGRRLMSSSRAGVSTFNFIRSSSVVPPATKRTSAPCCAVLARAAVATAVAGSLGRRNSKVFMTDRSGWRLSVVANLLDGGHDIGIGSAAADVAAHQFLHGRVTGTAWFLEQGNGRHDLAGRAIAALVSVAGNECRLHGMHGAGGAEAFNGCDLFAVVHQGQAKA